MARFTTARSERITHNPEATIRWAAKQLNALDAIEKAASVLSRYDVLPDGQSYNIRTQADEERSEVLNETFRCLQNR